MGDPFITLVYANNVYLCFTYIVGSRGEVKLGSPVLACTVGVPLRLLLLSLFFSMKVPLKSQENQNTCLTYLSDFETLFFL